MACYPPGFACYFFAVFFTSSESLLLFSRYFACPFVVFLRSAAGLAPPPSGVNVLHGLRWCIGMLHHSPSTQYSIVAPPSGTICTVWN